MTARRPALTCLSLTGALAALAIVVSTWTLPAPEAVAPALPSTPAGLAQAPLDVPEDALPALAPLTRPAAPAQGAPAGEPPAFAGLLYVLALLGTGLAAAYRRDGA
ncbi:hypothetical protein [Azohydromonas lata]|uniref:hypothetical protein n=1 Tax=Azohydromonas lata TaxID=45677 RepID=UPI00082D4193|nr:hypothetical protein [Azohydromonas lata]